MHTHDDANRLLEDDDFTYTYDANGNLETKTSKAVPTDVTTYTWDAQDQLIQITFPDLTTATYKYDGLGRRIEKNVNGTIARYIYDGEDLVLEYDGTNIFRARYSHGNQIDQPLALQKAGAFYFYHADHQGSITHLTKNLDGSVANEYRYDSYGNITILQESVIQPFTYTGREFDPESGLYYYRARYYDANTGRFLSEDPIRFNGQDRNLYRYVFNNPMNLVDPEGEVAGSPNLSGTPAFDPGVISGGAGGSEPRSSPNRLDNPGDFTATELIDGFLMDQARQQNEQRHQNLMDALERAGERMSEQDPNNPQMEIICPRGSICEQNPKDNDTGC